MTENKQELCWILAFGALMGLIMWGVHESGKEAVEIYKQFYFNAECEEYLKNRMGNE